MGVGRVAGLSVGLMLVVPAAAFGAPRYAAPAAQGTGDCSSAQNACDLTTAVNGASSGDDVIAVPGSYTLTSMLKPPAGVSLVGQAGSRPLINMSGSGSLGNFAANGTTTVTVSNLDLESTGSFAVAAASGATLSHLIVDFDTPTNQQEAVVMGPGSEIANSLVRSSGTAGNPGISVSGGSTPATTTLINDTVDSTGANSVGINAQSGCNGTMFSYQADVSVENVIAHGDFSAIENTESSFKCTPPLGVVNVSYSNYNSHSDHITDNGHNQTDPASTNPNSIFVTQPTDLHERKGAPTINAGTTVGIEATDLDGNPRLQGRAPDIGAYEFVPITTRCVVPKLKGKKLGKARKLLKAAHCSLGKVKKPKHDRGKLVVKSQSPTAGTVLANGGSVSVKLGPKHHKKH